ncbi:HD-GYP domain-containing protein [Gorillibacterium timonense]|uniref:HD-GYP domain-containing protein n=1 Tax=Gorillibacterium timonense TaxID=1689269 RepID=UPI00071CA841|nr:HD domain-containing phosphohydrolase [Gorillibacterium timonense]
MKYVSLDTVEPGQFLGKTIFAGSGAVLLAEGVQLTVFMINTLRRIGVSMLYIHDPLFEDAVSEDPVSEENKRLVMHRMGEALEAIRSGKDFSSKAVSISIDRLLEDISHNQEVLLQLSDIRTHDNAQFVHALNVATISALIGVNLGYSQVQLKELTIGALLHDIGKVESITDDASADPKRHHTWRGFELLKSKREFSLLIAHVAFQHHERPDGLGIPRSLTDDQIHPYAKIVKVANTYDNLLYNESGERMLPHEACEQMMAMAGSELDHEALVQFTRIVSIYPTGISVRLSSKEVGVVVGQHRGLPGRPVVRVIRQEFDGEVEVKEVDLAKHTTLFVESVQQ